MKNYPYKYKHIVSGLIKDLENPHPLDNSKDKTVAFECLLKDLSIKTFEDISNKKNFFKIDFNKSYYNIFIEFPDGGGKDISHNETYKKVSIPFKSNAAFLKAVKNDEPVLVINIYVPLSDDLTPDFSKRVYLIIDPKEIYDSKVVKKTWNSTSRWVKLEEILNVIKDEGFTINKKKNVYIVHSKKIKWFFNDILKKQYLKMIDSELNNMPLLDLEKESNKFKKWRRLFKEKLIFERGFVCEIFNCGIEIIELMIGSHIKPVNAIINDKTLTDFEKIKEISDPNNGFLLCPNHDALFDKFLITFNSKGVLEVSKSIVNKSSYFNLINGQSMIKICGEEVFKYLEYHNKEFDRKQNESYINLNDKL